MKKVLFVVDERMMGGVSIVLENLVKSFDNRKFDILVLHNRGERLADLKNARLIYGTPFFEVADLRFKDIVKTMSVRLIIKKLYLIFLLKTGFIKNKIIKERKKILNEKYDIEISFKDGIGTYFVAYGDSTKKYRWLHTDYSNNNPGAKYMSSYTKAINKFNKIVAISKYVGERFNNVFHRENDTIVIYNIIDTEKSRPTEILKKTDNKFELVTVGRLCTMKGYDRLINALDKLNKEGLFEDAVLKIVGSGPQENEYKELVNNSDLNDKIIFYGPSNTPWNYLQNGDVFVLVSRYAEAFPTTVIESLLNHIPVFSVEYVSDKETLNKKNSIVVKNTDEEIYNGLKYVLTNREKIIALKKNVLSYKYKNEESIKRIAELFEE